MVTIMCRSDDKRSVFIMIAYDTDIGEPSNIESGWREGGLSIK
jgi:hypothetical protein